MLNLGKLEGFPVEKHKALADRIEEKLTGAISIFSDYHDSELESLAQKFAKEIIRKGAFSVAKETSATQQNSQPTNKEYLEVDLQSTEEFESRDLGGSWVAKQAFDRLAYYLH